MLLFTEKKTSEPMAIEPMLVRRDNGQEVSLFPFLPQYSWKAMFYVALHFPVCIKHWLTQCYANIRSQAVEKIGKNFTLTLLCRPEKLPKLTEETGHIVWGMVWYGEKNSLYVPFVIRIYVLETSLPRDLPTTFSLALPWVAFVFQTNSSQSGLKATAQNGLHSFNS